MTIVLVAWISAGFAFRGTGDTRLSKTQRPHSTSRAGQLARYVLQKDFYNPAYLETHYVSEHANFVALTHDYFTFTADCKKDSLGVDPRFVRRDFTPDLTVEMSTSCSGETDTETSMDGGTVDYISAEKLQVQFAKIDAKAKKFARAQVLPTAPISEIRFYPKRLKTVVVYTDPTDGSQDFIIAKRDKVRSITAP